jgi:hypothetical protein
MEGYIYKVVREEIRNNSKSIIVTLAELNSQDEAESQLVEEAQRHGGKFERVDDGYFLVRKDKVIEEYKSKINVTKPNWVKSWVYSPINEVTLKLVSKYYVVICTPKGTVDGSSNYNQNSLTNQRDNILADRSEDMQADRSEDMQADRSDGMLNILVSIKHNGTITYGLYHQSDLVNIKPCPISIGELRKRVQKIYGGSQKLDASEGINASDTVNLEFLNKLVDNKVAPISDPLPINEEKPDNSELLARKLTMILSASRANDYIKWMQLCYALHNISDSLLDCFTEFSKKSNIYDHDKCAEAWLTKRNLNFNLDNLLEWAKEDDPAGYSVIVNADLSIEV